MDRIVSVVPVLICVGMCGNGAKVMGTCLSISWTLLAGESGAQLEMFKGRGPSSRKGLLKSFIEDAAFENSFSDS